MLKHVMIVVASLALGSTMAQTTALARGGGHAGGLAGVHGGGFDVGHGGGHYGGHGGGFGGYDGGHEDYGHFYGAKPFHYNDFSPYDDDDDGPCYWTHRQHYVCR